MSYRGFYLSHYGIPGQKKGYNKGKRNGKETAKEPEAWEKLNDSQKIQARMANPTGVASIKARSQILDRKQEVNSLNKEQENKNRRIAAKANIAGNEIRKAISDHPTIHPRKVKDSKRKIIDKTAAINKRINPVSISKRKGKKALNYVKKEVKPKYGNSLRNVNPKTKSKTSISDLSVRKRTLSRGAKKIQSLLESKTSKKAAPSMMNRKQVSEREKERLKKKRGTA